MSKSESKYLASSIVDNRKRGTVGAFLEEKIKPEAKLSFVSAYFTIHAYQQLKDKLDKSSSLRFLFGEPAFIRALAGEHSNQRKAEILDESLSIPIQAQLSQKRAALECAEWFREKAEIRSMVRPNFLHGKLYLIEQANGVKEAIAGSANFTVNGLGLGGTPNLELNLIVNDKRDLDDLESWFDDVWNDETGLVEDVKERVLEYLIALSAENQSQFIYYKTLFHLFGNYLSEQKENQLLDPQGKFYDSEIWNMLYDFQKDGVRGAINKINKHNGCIIADSVGLGKTFEALAVIKYFENLNAKVLVLCPKNLAANWTIYQSGKYHALSPFQKDKFNYSVLYHTDMGRKVGKSDADRIDFEEFKWGAFDLVVIDESHNFRGNPMERTTPDGDVKWNRAKWLMEKVIKEGLKTKVLLLSATPVNNDLRDLRNQILLMTEGKSEALLEKANIKNISSTLETAQKRFTMWADRKKNPNRSVKQLLEQLDTSFFRLLDELTIARSRKHIKSFYNLDAIGGFSERLKPKSIYAEIDTMDHFPSFEAITHQINQYKLSLFNPFEYVHKYKRDKYEHAGIQRDFGFGQGKREHFLIGMMRVNFLKRLESSIESFEISIDRTIGRIDKLINQIKQFQSSKKTSQPLSFDFEPNEDEREEDTAEEEQWQVGKKLKYDLADLRLSDWKRDLELDRMALIALSYLAHAITPDRDAKLKQLKETIANKLKYPINEGNKKVIVFTAFSDTASYLYDNLQAWAKNELGLDIALITGTFTKTTFGKNEFGNILTNFSPRSKHRARKASMPQTSEIDILIATDSISEGQNLQDCDFLINYDIHWNPVRIIQRFGRIDRLGSQNKQIQLVNFWATKDLDKYINLKNRVEARMALVDVTATGEENILSNDQVEDLIEEDLKYRNQQLKRLKEEALDLEEMSESVSLTDFTLDDFRQDLTNFLNVHKEALAAAPLGLYAVVPAPEANHRAYQHKTFSELEKGTIQPGVIFCLRQKTETEPSKTVNPLQPYFLVYIRNDGTVRFNYTNSKQVLEIFRLLCEGQTEPLEDLCKLFNRATDNGNDMTVYADLLKKAVAEISSVYKKRSAAKLTLDRNAVIAPRSQQVNSIADFELVTWLVIQ
ncbi:MAG: DEAD/DEAH box helicase family protein [Acidobacteria bacterium]|nr:DEAD/DEAH box helicase family protein [Acidobacteriota bacterium]